MKLYISKTDDRDAVILALSRNGYTVRQGTEKKPNSARSVSFVEIVEADGERERGAV